MSALRPKFLAGCLDLIVVAGAELRLAAECHGDMDSYAMYTCLRTSLRISLRIHHNGKSTAAPGNCAWSHRDVRTCSVPLPVMQK